MDNRAREWGYMNGVNPCAGVRSFREAGRDRYVADGELAALYAVADEPLRDALDLAYLTGQRPADVLKMNRADVQDGYLAVKQNKTGQRLRIAVVDKLAAVLNRIMSRPGHPCAHLMTELWNPKHCQPPTAEPPELPRPSNFEAWLTAHDKLVGRSKEDFIKHFREKYAPPIPLWVSIEVWDFGLLSHFYAGLNESHRRALASQFDLARAVLLASWLRSISHLRNICAHHSRLWNRSLTDNPKAPGQNEVPELDHIRGDANTHSRLHVYGTLAVMQYLLKKAGFDASWSLKLKALIGDFPVAAPIATPHTMGFPPNWTELPLWA